MASFQLVIGTALLACTLLALARLYLRRSSGSLPFPPGPKPLPLIGNAHQMPSSYEHVTFKKWADQYGDVIGVTVLGKPIVILNSSQAISDLLEKRASLYAGRPHRVMAGDLVGFGNTVAMTNNMARHKNSRKLYSETLSSRAAQAYWPDQMRESQRMLTGLLDHPERLEDHIKRTVIAVIFRISHGYEIQSTEDHYVWLGNKVVRNFSKAVAPGAYLVDFLPLLRYIPEWVPGANFKREAKLWRSEFFELLSRPFEMVKANLAAGIARPSVASRLLEQKDPNMPDALQDELIMWAAGGMYAAGSDTTVAAIHTFFLAMMQFPEVQAKAQAELDAVVGPERLPTFGDRDQLVYCGAILKETLRWRPIAPLAIPHIAAQDDTYAGYSIPKGCMVIGNIWATVTDPKVYPKPEIFLPERFLSTDGRTPQNPPGVRDIGSFCFGFGRRICPGASIAEASLYMAIVNTLWAFNVTKPIGADGLPTEPDMEYAAGLISHPKPFACDVKTRSMQAAALVRQAMAEQVEEAG